MILTSLEEALAFPEAPDDDGGPGAYEAYPQFGYILHLAGAASGGARLRIGS